MKALILAAGRGSRINELSNSSNKGMITLNDKPVIEYILDTIIKLDVSEIIIVVGYKAEDLIDRYGTNYKGRTIVYVNQSEQKGLVHAIEQSKELLDEDFLLLLGDELIFKPDHQGMIKQFYDSGAFAICGIVPVDNLSKISKTYSVFQDAAGKISRFVEKPKKPFNNLMGTGNCIFNKEILKYINKTPVNYNRNEKELPDLIQCAVDEGQLVKSYVLSNNYFNINSNYDLQEAVQYYSKNEL